MPMTHDELQAAIWNDDRRLPPGTREAALAIGWVLHCEPENKDQLWKRVTKLLGWDGRRWRIYEIIAGDAPRYESGRWSRGAGVCEGPRLRPYKPRRPADAGRCIVAGHHPHLGDCQFTVISYAHLDGTLRPYPGPEHATPERDDRVCGAQGTIEVTERDMVTGWETAHWFCRRHLERARQVKTLLAARGEAPDPVPNQGGLLPRYFAGDWARIYERYCEKAHQTWTPPYYGVDADEWPSPGKTLIPKRPRLAIVAGLP